jgi:hypothetical protein
MAKETRRPRLSAIALILAVTLGAGSRPGRAQDPATPEVRPPVPSPTASGASTLVIIADAEPETKASTVQERVRLAALAVLRQKGVLKDNEPFPKERVKVDPLTRETFETLARFIVEGSMPGSGEDPGGLALRPYSDDLWILNLGGPYTLDELTVKYEPVAGFPGDGAGPGNTRTFKAGDPGVSRKSIGVYTIAGIIKDKSRRPVSYTVRRNDGTKSQTLPEVTWPKENTYWEITLRDFQGDQAMLFDTLADEETFANPLIKKQVSERKLALGSMLKVQTETGVGFTGNTVTFRFFTPPKKSPSRVWIKFPVSPDEVKDQLAKYKAYDEFELPEQIEMPVLANVEVELTPRRSRSEEPRWYEILPSADGQVFERKFEIGQIGLWKEQARENKPVMLLIVWQKDNEKGGTKQAYEFVDPITKESYKVKAEEVIGWPIGVKNLDAGR